MPWLVFASRRTTKMQSVDTKRSYITIPSALAAVLMLGITFPAHAALERVGPVNAAPSVGSFPAWYQDASGLSLEFCDPLNASEVAGGWCLLLPADVPTVPETFPAPFFVEHFYFDANTSMVVPRGGKAFLVLAVEASFAGPAIPAPGQQITFARIRVKYDPAPVAGTYRFIHP